MSKLGDGAKNDPLREVKVGRLISFLLAPLDTPRSLLYAAAAI